MFSFSLSPALSLSLPLAALNTTPYEGNTTVQPPPPTKPPFRPPFRPSACLPQALPQGDPDPRRAHGRARRRLRRRRPAPPHAGGGAPARCGLGGGPDVWPCRPVGAGPVPACRGRTFRPPCLVAGRRPAGSESGPAAGLGGARAERAGAGELDSGRRSGRCASDCASSVMFTTYEMVLGKYRLIRTAPFYTVQPNVPFAS